MDSAANSNNVTTGKKPEQKPQRFNRDQIPDKLLRSGAIESLISHNEDLMSRLQVTLRRISILEEKLHQSEKAQKKFSFHYKNLKDQVLVLKEREKYLRERKDLAENQFSSLKQKIRALEIEYARFYTSSQEDKIAFMKSIEELSRHNKRLKKSKSKLSFIAHKLRKSFKNTKNELEVTNRDFVTLKTKLAESTTYIQEQARRFTDEKRNLEEKSQKNINELHKELTSLKQKRDQFDTIYDENVKLQNQLVFVQRKNDENRDNFNEEVSKLQDSLSHYRREAKSQALSIRNYTSEIEEKDNNISELKGEVATLKDQLESVQCLWRDNQEQLEKQAQTNESLQKLNQQVSTQLNRYRQELKEVRNRFEGERQESAEKIRQMKTHIQAIQLFSKDNSNQNLSEKKGLPPIVNNLQTLITDIETEFNREL